MPTTKSSASDPLDQHHQVLLQLQSSCPASRFASRNNSIVNGIYSQPSQQRSGPHPGHHQKRCETSVNMAVSSEHGTSAMSTRDRIAIAQSKRRQSPSIAAANFFPHDFFYNKSNGTGSALHQQTKPPQLQHPSINTVSGETNLRPYPSINSKNVFGIDSF